jgi:phage tail sheath protein FI
MAEYLTPGVYYERVDAGAPPIAPLRTDVAGFVGIARRGPLHRAIPIDSWRQFQAWFGDVFGAGYLAYAARGFFECGGRRAWIVRVASPTAAIASRHVATATIAAAWSIEASSAGVWGNDLDIRLVETHRSQTRSIAKASTPDYSTVASVAGFVRGSHVRVPTAPGAFLYRSVAFVDADAKRLYWVHPDPRARHPWEQPLAVTDPNASLVIETIEYTLLVFVDSRVVGRYADLSLVPGHPRYGAAIVSGMPMPPPDERGWSVPQAPPLVRIVERRDEAEVALAEPLDVAATEMPLDGGADGLAALAVRDFVGEATSPLDSDEIVAARRLGLRALERAREVALVAVPDIHIQPVPPPEFRPLPRCMPDPCLPAPPPLPAPTRPKSVGDLPPAFGEDDVYRVQAAMIDHCESLRDRVAILDAPFDTARDPRLGVGSISAWRRRFDSSFGALYFPWLAVSDPLRTAGAPTRAIPPSGHVAGAIAATDILAGVHKAPANVALSWVQDLTVPIDDGAHGVLNPGHVNAVRAFPGRGIRVFGARTLSSDGDLRYLNVRRLLLMIEKAIQLAIRWAVFEPNDAATRSTLHLSVTAFLLALWQKGALAGNAPADAFFVRCDEHDNPPDARARGEMLAEIGVAAVTPFEFVVLRVGRVDNDFEVAEAGTVAGVLA